MRRIQFRVWLPWVILGLSVVLMARGIDVERRCVFYDAGRPFWLCKSQDFALNLLSAPAIHVGQRLANLWRGAPFYFPYLIELPLVFLWWWFIGTRLDFGVLGVGRYRHRRLWLGCLLGASLLLLALFGGSQWEVIQYYRSYVSVFGDADFAFVRSFRLLPEHLWLLILSFALALAALRVARGETGQTGKRLASPRTMRIFGIGLALYCVCAAGVAGYTKWNEHRLRAEFDRHRIMIRGRVVDERGAPITAIRVDLLPVLNNGEIQSDANPYDESVADFTNGAGEYLFSPAHPGRYLVSVLWNAPPSASHPFLTRYYPDTADLTRAERLEIAPEQHLTLSPIQLQRVGLVKVPVSVSWSNGKAEPDAYLLFTNTLYPLFGALGNEGLHPDDDGTVTLPSGYDYTASAQVACDGDTEIDQAYTPRLTFSLKPAGVAVQPQHFVLPGKPCTVWHPQ